MAKEEVITIKFSAKTAKLFVQLAEALSSLMDDAEVEEKSTVSAKQIAKDLEKPKKKKAAKKEEIEEDEEAEESETVEEDAEEEEVEEEASDSEDEDDSEDSSEEESDTEEEPKVTDAQLKQLKGALKAYADENSKASAIKILSKFAQSSQDVKQKDFKKLLSLLRD